VSTSRRTPSSETVTSFTDSRLAAMTDLAPLSPWIFMTSGKRARSRSTGFPLRPWQTGTTIKAAEFSYAATISSIVDGRSSGWSPSPTTAALPLTFARPSFSDDDIPKAASELTNTLTLGGLDSDKDSATSLLATTTTSSSREARNEAMTYERTGRSPSRASIFGLPMRVEEPAARTMPLITVLMVPLG